MDIIPEFNYDDFNLYVKLYGMENTIKMLKEYSKELLKCKL